MHLLQYLCMHAHSPMKNCIDIESWKNKNVLLQSITSTYLVYYCKNKRFTTELLLSIKSLLNASKVFQRQIFVSFTWSIPFSFTLSHTICRELSVNFIYKEMKNDQIQSTTLASPLFGGQKHPAENYQQQLCCQRGGSTVKKFTVL